MNQVFVTADWTASHNNYSSFRRSSSLFGTAVDMLRIYLGGYATTGDLGRLSHARNVQVYHKKKEKTH